MSSEAVSRNQDPVASQAERAVPPSGLMPCWRSRSRRRSSSRWTRWFSAMTARTSPAWVGPVRWREAALCAGSLPELGLLWASLQVGPLDE